MPRRRILSPSEMTAFEAPPICNAAARKRFFTIPMRIDEIVARLESPANKVCFVVIFGYFKATHKFFRRQFHTADLDYVAGKLGIRTPIQRDRYKEATYRRHKVIILNHFGWRGFHQEEQTLITTEVSSMVRSQLRPKLIFLQVLGILTRKKIEIPSYNTLANLIVHEANIYKRELSQLIEWHLSTDCRQLLESLLEKVETGQSEEVTVLGYKLTLLKKIHQSTKPSKIKAKIHDLLILRELFTKLQDIIQLLDLPDEGIRYYATSVIKSEVFNVVRRTEEDRYLHLIAFIMHQYFKLHDSLLDTLLTCAQSALNSAKREHKEQYYEARKQRNHTMKEAVGCLDKQVFVVSQIKEIIHSPMLSAQEKVKQVDGLLLANEAQQQSTEERLAQLKYVSEQHGQDMDFYTMLESKSLKMQQRMSDIVKHMAFHHKTSCSNMIEAITHYQSKDGNVDKQAPTAFLEPKEQEELFTCEGKFRVSLYKALLFLKVAESMKAGTLNLQHSYKYRSLEEYLIPQNVWQQNKAEYLKRADLSEFASCETVLSTMKTLLNKQYQQTNQRILQGNNPSLTFRKDRLFSIATPKRETHDRMLLADLFPTTKYISLLEVLATIQKASHFLDAFEHWHIKYNRERPRNATFCAGIIGQGCDIGGKKIVQISKNINASEFDTTMNWYFSVETVNAANTKILELTDSLDLPNIYRQEQEVLHTASDGQRFSVAVESLNANFSFKYFGKDKGVSVHSFIDERHLLFYSTVVSSSEREAAYVIDGLMHNDVVQSDIHSTDTHGYSEVVFGVMHLLGFSFAPRIKNLKKQQLYAFQERKHYERRGYKILPSGAIKEKQFQDQWDDTLRFVATIKLKETTASQLFKRLNSYSKQHPLYQALKEFGKIIKSLFILTYLDDLALRQMIQKMLNKIESAHKFSKAIAFGNNQEFLQGVQEEQQIAQGCRRLIENAIICWNYLYLSQQVANEKDEQRKQELLEAIKHGSVVTWQHINLHGEYDFSEEKLQDSVGLNVSKILDLKIL